MRALLGEFAGEVGPLAIDDLDDLARDFAITAAVTADDGRPHRISRQCIAHSVGRNEEVALAE